MLLAKVKDNKVICYPYDFSDFLLDNNNTNYGDWPINILDLFPHTDTAQLGYQCVQVQIDPVPVYDPRTQNCAKKDTPVLRGSDWIIEWQLSPKTVDEIALEATEQAKEVRSNRNTLLTKTDWTQVADAPVDQAAWATYRQALRDVPNQAGFPWDITWPTQP